MEKNIYKIIDVKTTYQIGNDYSYQQRKRARARAEKLNLEYGCHRYHVKVIFN